MTGRDLIASSLRLIGALASGETPSASEATDGLNALNDLIDSWSNERLLIYSIVREAFSLNPAKQTYTFGSGGDFNSARPQKVENALIQLNSTSPAIEIELHMLNKDEYASVIMKTMTSTFPRYIYIDEAYPSANVNLWPVPTDTGNKLVLYSWKALSQIATLDTAISLPPGYERALRFNLAVDLAPEYGKQIQESVAAIAIESKAVLKRMNTKPLYLRVTDMPTQKRGAWNWMTGDPT